MRAHNVGAVIGRHEHEKPRGSLGQPHHGRADKCPGRPGKSHTSPVRKLTGRKRKHGRFAWRLWRARAGVTDDRTVPQRRTMLARGGVQSLQDPGEIAGMSSTATTKPRCYRLRRPPPKRPTALVLAGFYHECSKKRLKYAFRRPNQ